MTNLGVELKELFEFLETNHEIEFSYHGRTYSMEGDSAKAGGIELVMYQCSPQVLCLCRIPVGNNRKKAVERLLSEKCLNGKSFLDLVDEIHVDEIF